MFVPGPSLQLQMPQTKMLTALFSSQKRTPSIFKIGIFPDAWVRVHQPDAAAAPSETSRPGLFLPASAQHGQCAVGANRACGRTSEESGFN